MEQLFSSLSWEQVALAVAIYTIPSKDFHPYVKKSEVYQLKKYVCLDAELNQSFTKHCINK